jgi:hypothetical protein
MAYFRIHDPDVGVQQVGRQETAFKHYFDRLFRLIPSEVVSLYLVGSGLIPNEEHIGLLLWSIVCLVAIVVSRTIGTADPKRRSPPQLGAVAISSISFVIWVYALGGPFRSYNLHIPWLSSLLVLGWTFFVPYLYRGTKEA